MGKSKAVLALLAIMVVIADVQYAPHTKMGASRIRTANTIPSMDDTDCAPSRFTCSHHPCSESPVGVAGSSRNIGDQNWEAVSSITVTGSDWRCKDVYTVYGLTLQQFTAMNVGIDCSALLPQGRKLVVKELLPACSAFYYVQPADTCSSVAQFLSITEESLQQLNPSVSCSSRLPAFHSLCVERNPAKARPTCANKIRIGRVVDFKQVAASNGATMVDLCRLNPWISFRDSPRDIHIVNAESSITGVCGYDRVSGCLGGTCIHRGTQDSTCVCLPNHPLKEYSCGYSQCYSCDQNWAAVSSIKVAASNWRCKDVYTVYGLTLQQFTHMNHGINCSALLPQGRDLVVKELLPACSAFYYVQPFLSITKESLQQLNPGVSCSSRLLAFRSLCVERNPAKAKPSCENTIKIGRVVDFQQVAASNGATMVDLCRLNPWISFRDSLRNIDIVCFSHIYSFSDVRGVLQ
ncbi:unnamed protein product [Closterium sp. NIES-65]|nr:unnamed protein product [Closterium sp. NIES-65]